jgi:hypothetical protein
LKQVIHPTTSVSQLLKPGISNKLKRSLNACHVPAKLCGSLKGEQMVKTVFLAGLKTSLLVMVRIKGNFEG